MYKVIEKLEKKLRRRLMSYRQHVLNLYPPLVVYHLEVCRYLSLWLAEGHHRVYYILHIAKVSLVPEQLMLPLHVRGPKEEWRGEKEGWWKGRRKAGRRKERNASLRYLVVCTLIPWSGRLVTMRHKQPPIFCAIFLITPAQVSLEWKVHKQ